MVTKRTTTTRTRKTPVKKAVKPEVRDLRDYELVYIIKPDIAEENLDPVIEKINQLVASKGGSISGTEKWGKRKMSYPIKHYSEGNYIFNKMQLAPNMTREIENNLQISDEVLRFMIVLAVG